MSSSNTRDGDKDHVDKDDQQANEAVGVGQSGKAATAEQVDTLASALREATLSGEEEKPEKVIDDLSLKGIAQHIRDGHIKNIVVMAGAGISTSAGIPDFRSPGSGIYHNLAKYDLPRPEAIFELSYFKENPEPFFQLAKELWPGLFKPTPCHYFIRLLQEKKLLLRMYTQNIDTLERVAGINDDVLVEAHGTFHTARCLECRHVYTQDWMKEKIFSDIVPLCTQKIKCSEEDEEEFTCGGVVKPDIVFFGEALPPRFSQCAGEDLPKCDLLIILGTSLVVHPFASLVNRVGKRCLRLYINLEKSESPFDPLLAMFGALNSFKFDDEDNYRDVFHQATCDDGCFTLAELLGWKGHLQRLIDAEHRKITGASNITQPKSDQPTTSSKKTWKN